MDQLHLISVFVAVVDANGFAGAARKLNISPPAVTRAINDLESQLGVRLLTRTTRVVRVTEPGARYAEDYRRLLAERAEADESVGLLHGAPRGRLVLTAPVFVEDELLRLAASAERGSEHPLASAIVSGATARNILLSEATRFQALSGRGVEAAEMPFLRSYSSSSVYSVPLLSVSLTFFLR